jgi:opacity protein-like surface antigen
MKHFICVLALAAACLTTLQAQTPDTMVQQKDTTWKHTGVASLSATQVAFTDWAQGGENAIAWTVRLEGKSEMTLPLWIWTNNYKFAYGQAKLGDKSIRKTDDQIDLGSVLTYKTGWPVNPYAAATLKTQFTEGYTYDANDNRTAVSTFFDPAYLVQSVGFEYKPSPVIKTRFGAALREVITSTYTSYADDPKTTAIEKTKTAGGVESVTDLELKLDDNLLFTSHLELFDPIDHLDQVIVRSDNMLTAKVSKYIVVSLNLVLVNDVQVTPRTQVKQMLALGINYSIF